MQILRENLMGKSHHAAWGQRLHRYVCADFTDALLRYRSQDAGTIALAKPKQLTRRTNLIRSSSNSWAAVVLSFCSPVLPAFRVFWQDASRASYSWNRLSIFSAFL